MTTETTAQLQFVVLTGPQFEDAMSGDGAGNSHWLLSPRLKYYFRASALSRGPDTRVFFICHEAEAKWDEEQHLTAKRPVGMLEIERYEHGLDNEYGMKYVTVLPEYQRRHIAAKLLRMLTHFLKTRDACLNRSMPTEEGEQKIQLYIDRLFEAHEVCWRQGARSRNFK